DDHLEQWKTNTSQILSDNKQTLIHENRLLNKLYRGHLQSAIKYYEKHKSLDIKLFTPIVIPNIVSFYIKKKDYHTAIKITEMGIAQYPEIRVFQKIYKKIKTKIQ
ncbi:MAG: hypothetical protein C0599_08490, partial [Salinivirgaceae bacterium]